MALNEQQLLDLKQEVDDAKITVSELTGQKQALMKQLKEDWDCTTIEQAEEKLGTMEKNINILEKKITRGVRELEEMYKPEEK